MRTVEASYRVEFENGTVYEWDARGREDLKEMCEGWRANNVKFKVTYIERVVETFEKELDW